MEKMKLNIQRFAQDGTIVIGTKVDSSGIETGLKDIEGMINQYGKKEVIHSTPIPEDLDEIYDKIDDMIDVYSDIKSENEDIYNVIKKIDSEVDIQSANYREQLELALEKNKLTWEEYNALRKIKSANDELLKQQEEQYQNLRVYAVSKEYDRGGDTSNIPMNLEEGSETGGSKATMVMGILSKVKDVAKSILSVVGKIIGSVLTIGTIIAGVTVSGGILTTIVGSLVKSIRDILEENKQLIANIRYIIFMVSKMIDNIAQGITGKVGSALQGIANIVYTIVVLFGRLLSWLFKIDVFAGITNEEFQKWNENVNKANSGLGSAVGHAKDLKKQLAGFDEMNVLQEPTSSGGGGGGSVGGDLPLPNFKGLDEIKVPKWLQWIIDNADIIAGIVTMIAGALVALKLGLDPLMGLGIGSILAGIVLLIIDIIDFIKDPTWENFKTLIDDFLIDLALIIGGIAVLTGQWIPGVIAIVMLLAGLIIRYWDEIKEALGKAWSWFKEKVIDPIVNLFKSAWDKIKEVFAPFINFFSSLFGTLWENIKIMINNIKIIVNWIAGIIKEVFSAVWNRIKEIFSPVVEWFKGVWEKALAKIKEVFGPIVDWISNIWDKIKSKLKEWGTKIAEVIGGAFKSVINGVIGAIESILNKPIKAINGLIDKIKGIPGLGGLTKLKTFSFTRLASGGIINQPGRGVAIGGESGREGVLPLTNDGAMRLLGQEIGKWITINASITNTMNGRVISRELAKVQNNMDFAYNR